MLKNIRLYELEQMLQYLPPISKVLEIGAGAGWQAQVLAAHNHDVEAIDIAESLYATQREFPVLEYDGIHIPYPDNTFDVVFSSNTLEHIPGLSSFQQEIRRVLKPDGMVIHILPTASWRLWTSLSHYVFIVRMVLTLFGFRKCITDANLIEHKRANRSIANLIRKTLFSPRHGERGNAVLELWLFSRYDWRRLFRQTNWHIEREIPLRLFYTGYSILDSQLDIGRRVQLSKILGSSTRLFVLRIDEHK